MSKYNRHLSLYRAEIKELLIVTDGQMDELIRIGFPLIVDMADEGSILQCNLTVVLRSIFT